MGTKTSKNYFYKVSRKHIKGHKKYKNNTPTMKLVEDR